MKKYENISLKKQFLKSGSLIVLEINFQPFYEVFGELPVKVVEYLLVCLSVWILRYFSPFFNGFVIWFQTFKILENTFSLVMSFFCTQNTVTYLFFHLKNTLLIMETNLIVFKQFMFIYILNCIYDLRWRY